MKVLTCNEIKELVVSGAQLIDVRSPVEFRQGALDGAENYPIESIHQSLNRIDKEKPILLYCRTGRRSEFVRNFFQSIGFKEVINIGGIEHYPACYQAAA